MTGRKAKKMKKLEMRLDLFGESETVSAPVQATVTGTEAAQPAAQEAMPAEGVNAQPQREGRRQNIFPRVQRAQITRAQPRQMEVRQFPAAGTAKPSAPQPEQTQQAAAETWEDVKKRFKAEYGADVKAAVDDRFRNHQDQSARLNSAMQVLTSIAPFYGINADEAGNIDLDKLSKAIQDDDRFYEKSALEKGIPVETEKHIRQLEMQQKQRDLEARRSLEQERIRAHVSRLREQEAELKKDFPDFDLMREIQSNVAFARMTSPDSGLTVRQAYMAVHGDEIMQRQAQATEERTKQTMSRAIQAGAVRPQENGMVSSGGGLPRIDPAHMSREDRAELRRRVRAGERIAF